MAKSRDERVTPVEGEPALDAELETAAEFDPSDERGAIGYIALWLMGVPASVLFLFFLMRGCT